MRIEFRVLGPLEVSVEGRVLEVGEPQQQVVLGLLLLAPGRVVPLDQLVDAVWADRPPATAHKQIRNRAAALRRLFAAAGCQPEIIATHASGYRINIDPQSIDSHTFDERVHQARAAERAGRLREARDRLRGALALWRGPLLAGLSAQALASAGAAWEERRLATLEDCVAYELALGCHHEIVADLTTITAAHPLRERLRAQLMLALYRCGRQAEALEVYRDVRQLLDAELGLSPGPELNQLQVRILQSDPGLDLASLDSSPPARPAAGHRKPAQLPTDVSGFMGREVELAQLDARLADHDTRAAGGDATAVVISAISGTAGVGKTALAVRWAHRVADRFPDGQLYVNLRGYDPGVPVTASEALARFLSALGVSGQDIPLEGDERAARYRTELAGRRVLVVLDNASTVDQVRALLPGTRSCAVVVTSRDSLAGLVAVHGAHRLHLDLLPPADAVGLLRRLIGPRIDTEFESARALAEQCARLPLALRVAAELAASRPNASLAELVDELGDQQRRLELLDAGGDPHAAVGAVFSWSIQALPPDAAQAFRLLGLHPGPDIDPYALAALAGIGVEEARPVLSRLGRAHLIHPTGAGRYGMHDLLRAYATSLATANEAPDQPQAALDRLFDYYLAAASAAMDGLHPAEAHRRPRIPRPATAIPSLVHPDRARAWLDSERPCLVAVAAHTAAHGWPTHTVSLSAILYRYLDGGHYTDALAVHTHALRAARQTNDQAGRARACFALGQAYLQLGQYEPAVNQLERALAGFRQVGDHIGQGRALASLGAADQRSGRFAAAARLLRQALALFRQTGDQTGEAAVLTNLGIVEDRLGHHEPAVAHHGQALALFRETGDRAGEAYTLNNLAIAELRLARYEMAAEHAQQALDRHRQLGNLRGEAHALDTLGCVHTRLGQPRPATEQLERALTLFRAIGDREGEAWVLNGLGEAAHAAGDPGTALAHHTAALAVAIETGARDQQARAQTGLDCARHPPTAGSRPGR